MVQHGVKVENAENVPRYFQTSVDTTGLIPRISRQGCRDIASRGER